VFHPSRINKYCSEHGAVKCLNAYGFMDLGSQEKLLVVLRENMTNSPTKVRIAFYPPRVMRETKLNGQTFSVLEKTNSFREVKLN
jgi:hypothetical protein